MFKEGIDLLYLKSWNEEGLKESKPWGKFCCIFCWKLCCRPCCKPCFKPGGNLFCKLLNAEGLNESKVCEGLKLVKFWLILGPWNYFISFGLNDVRPIGICDIWIFVGFINLLPTWPNATWFGFIFGVKFNGGFLFWISLSKIFSYLLFCSFIGLLLLLKLPFLINSKKLLLYIFYDYDRLFSLFSLGFVILILLVFLSIFPLALAFILISTFSCIRFIPLLYI